MTEGLAYTANLRRLALLHNGIRLPERYGKFSFKGCINPLSCRGIGIRNYCCNNIYKGNKYKNTQDLNLACFLIFFGRCTRMLFKKPYKIVRVGNTNHLGDLINRVLFTQKLFGKRDAAARNIIGNAASKMLLGYGIKSASAGAKFFAKRRDR